MWLFRRNPPACVVYTILSLLTAVLLFMWFLYASHCVTPYTLNQYCVRGLDAAPNARSVWQDSHAWEEDVSARGGE